MENFSGTPQVLFLGKLQRDFFVTPQDKLYLDVLGGNLVYSAVGYKIWVESPPPGLVARVGEDYPQQWFDVCRQYGLDTNGIKILPDAVDLREFYVIDNQGNKSLADPVNYFSHLGEPLPRSLLGYHNREIQIDSKVKLSPLSIRQNDIPNQYLDTTAAHLCPLDFLSHSLLPALFRQEGFTTVTLRPSSGYMNTTFYDEYPSIVSGLTAFLPSEKDLRNLFAGKTDDLWEMAEAIAEYHCDIVVINRGIKGQLLYDAETGTRWEIPAYPARVKNLTGSEDAFCGGFLAGFRKTFEPLAAALYGNVSASLVSEGHETFFALDALPGLAEARLDALRQNVLRV